MKTSEVLRKAGDVLRQRGWCQGDYERNGSHCAVGAMRATGEVDTWEPAHLLGVVISGESVAAALRFNDSRGRTAAEVLIAMDAAYVVALQEEGAEPSDVLA